ncbi:NAD(P)/FAD-dependent oxidoreductase [Thalassolituus sp.]|uniref:flavin-containing monooxygenase n=1 Tax=Thalassolituus sp. TaxID=2030822 RepID=UPI0026121951|nr:NAD(P)/FAD-dependent oxidoreductase [uncultured Thalassolituus sp.]
MANEFFDVLIIGAGLSGIGAACHLKKECPGKSFAILEGRQAIGGTWDLFRYPGIRSDSDMYTLGYDFKPWVNQKGIADGDDIRGYIQEAAQENDVESHIRFGHKVTGLNYSSADSLWTVDVEVNGEARQYRAQFVLSCTGYYNYNEGFTPEFDGREDFKGQVLHPQFWPEDLDYTGKKVVVIGSGATAVTLVPAMTDKAEKVTMLQRSPSYVISVPQMDPVIKFMRKIMPEKWVYKVTRGRNVTITLAIYNFCKKFPGLARKLLQKQVAAQLPKDFDMKHFTPKYNPWDERLCAVPNGDMFKAISKGKADVVTNHIDRFVENGILLKDGSTLEADIIITATGLKIQLLGGIDIKKDGEIIPMNEKMSYRGLMFQDVPNFGMIFGYTNASWTLKADMLAKWFCGLLKHMDHNGVRQVQPVNHGGSMETRPFVDMQSGYIARVADTLPRQGMEKPWKLYQNYFADMASLKLGKYDVDTLEYSNQVVTSEPRTA